ncbi:hypothetical protein [Eupransor demetentiae]|uniref:Gram-positive cocci surface proteins LPxTG domain-containing protein n=1 Tax=Eupransor demetentiae TaxID=3109584 RepID=A0ABM9N3Z6_9LACO|nr:hypothetical protein R54876_GBNLAHCA_00435 [Lactobacillaceae bacterium LMG 33000]
MKEQTNIAANNSLKTKLALGVFSVAGLTATAGLMNNITASADDTTTNENTSQNQETANAANTQAYALPASQATAAQADVPAGKNILPSPSLDDAVKKAQDAGISTKQVDGNTYKGTPAQYQDILDESDSDYADQVGNILAQITDFNGYNKKADAATDQLEDLNNLVAKAQQSGVDVNQDPQTTGLNFTQIKDDYNAQIKALQDAINAKHANDSDIAQDNYLIDQAVAAAKDAGVKVKQTADVAFDDSDAMYKDVLSQYSALNAPAGTTVTFHHYTAKKVVVNYHVNQLPKNAAADTINYHYNQSDIEGGDVKPQPVPTPAHHDKHHKHGQHFAPVAPVFVDGHGHHAKSALPATAKQAETISNSAAYFFGISAAMSLVAAFALRRKEN